MRHSIEAEQHVLGAILINPGKLDDVSLTLAAEDFYTTGHQAIYSAMLAMAEAGAAIEVITLDDWMRERGQEPDTAYLVELYNNTPGTANVMAYSQIVADRSMDRRIAEAGRRIMDLGETELPLDDKLNTLHLEFEALERRDTVEAADFNQITKACVQRIDNKFRGMTVDTMKTGFDVLDARLVVEPTDMWVIAGRPGQGKTALAMNIAYNVARSGKEVLVFSMEMSKEQLADRLLCATSGLSTDLVRSGKLVEQHWPMLSAGISKLKDLKIHIIETPAIDVNRAIAIARKYAKRGNLGLIVIDYLQLMTCKAATRFDVVSEVSRKIKVMAKTVNAPVIALSQLSRKCEDRGDKKPQMSDLRETGQIEQDADIISFIYREDYYFPDTPNAGTAEIITSKFRNGEPGTDIIGTQLQFARFSNIETPAYQYGWAKSAKSSRSGGFD